MFRATSAHTSPVPSERHIATFRCPHWATGCSGIVLLVEQTQACLENGQMSHAPCALVSKSRQASKTFSRPHTLPSMRMWTAENIWVSAASTWRGITFVFRSPAIPAPAHKQSSRIYLLQWCRDKTKISLIVIGSLGTVCTAPCEHLQKECKESCVWAQ